MHECATDVRWKIERVIGLEGLDDILDIMDDFFEGHGLICDFYRDEALGKYVLSVVVLDELWYDDELEQDLNGALEDIIERFWHVPVVCKLILRFNRGGDDAT